MTESQRVEICRLCRGPLSETALSLGEQPISNRLPKSYELSINAAAYPLEIVLCTQCGLPQLAHNLDASAHFHDDYAYVSGASATWVSHCRRYADALIENFGLGPSDLVVEAGSNDGTLLKAFVERGVRVLGVEPSGNVAEMARASGVQTKTAFFNDETAKAIIREHGKPRAFIGNNVLAHVPDTHAFLCAARDLIASDGFLCFEFPHFTKILTHRYFDTIYHEHYAYLGVGPLLDWAKKNGMTVSDVQRQPTHGGSLRVFLKHQGNNALPSPSPRLSEILGEEAALSGVARWRELDGWLAQWRRRIMKTIDGLDRDGKVIAGYAAASKATVISNYLGLTAKKVRFCCDASGLKQGRYIPGAGIRIEPPAALKEQAPDAIIVFAWNIYDEIEKIISGLIDKPTVIIRPLPDINVATSMPMARQ